MALTRKFLKSIGLNDDQIDSVIEEHTTVTGELKSQISTYKADAEKLSSVQKELDDVKAQNEKAEDWESKYNAEHKAFEDYKTGQEQEKTTATMKAEYKRLLKEANVDEKRFDAILKVTDFSNMKLTKEGKLYDESKIAETIKTDWAGFVVTSKETGQKVDTPQQSKVSSGVGDNAEYIRMKGRQFHGNLYGAAKEGE